MILFHFKFILKNKNYVYFIYKAINLQFYKLHLIILLTDYLFLMFEYNNYNIPITITVINWNFSCNKKNFLVNIIIDIKKSEYIYVYCIFFN